MTLIFEYDLDIGSSWTSVPDLWVRSHFIRKLLPGYTHGLTHLAYRSTGTTKLVGNNNQSVVSETVTSPSVPRVYVESGGIVVRRITPIEARRGHLAWNIKWQEVDTAGRRHADNGVIAPTRPGRVPVAAVFYDQSSVVRRRRRRRQNWIHAASPSALSGSPSRKLRPVAEAAVTRREHIGRNLWHIHRSAPAAQFEPRCQ